MTEITLKQKEAKTLRFIITEGGAVLDVSTATLSFVVKAELTDDFYTIEKVDGAFNKVDAATGIVTVPLSSSDLDLDPGGYYAELETVFAADNQDRSSNITIVIEHSVH